MKLSILCLSLVSSFYLYATENQSEQVFKEEKKRYLQKSEELNNRLSERLALASNRYLEAVKNYGKKDYSKARKEIDGSYKSAFAGLQKYMNGDSSNKAVLNSFVKNIIEQGMAKKSFDTMVLAISGINSVNSCELVKVAPPKDSFFSKLPGPEKFVVNKLVGVNATNGYVEPFSHDFFKAASAVYLLGLASYQSEYEQRTSWLKDISKKVELPSQKEALELNADLTKVSIDYLDRQVELKKVYRGMLFSAAKAAGDETNIKASRISYRGDRKNKAKKDYDKKKKRAGLSDHAAREAVKAYQKYKTRKYEYDQSRVHTHISCGSLSGTQASVNYNYKKYFYVLLNSIIGEAMAEEENPLYTFYLKVIEEQKVATNKVMEKPESRYQFLNKETMDLVKNDIDVVSDQVTELRDNLAQIENLYQQYVGSTDAVVLEGGGGDIKNDLKKPEIVALGSSMVNNGGPSGISSLSGGLSGGALAGSDLLQNVSARIKKANDELKEVKFQGASGTKGVDPKSFLEKPDSFSLEQIKKDSLSKLTAAQKAGLEGAYKGRFSSRAKADSVEVMKDKENIKSAIKVAVRPKSKKSLNLPDIEDDPALKLLRKKPAKEKMVKDEDVEPIDEETLAKLRDGTVTDINDDRSVSIWTIISNRYVRSGFEKLKERK